MIVLPGTLCVELAFSALFSSSQGVRGTIRNIRFLRPVILSETEPASIFYRQKRSGDHIEFAFFESESGSKAVLKAGEPFATLVVDQTGSTARSFDSDGVDPAAFQKRAQLRLEGKNFYRKLKANGNQFGPAFQTIKAIHVAGNEALARIEAPTLRLQTKGQHAFALLLDSLTQVLGGLVIENGRTFVLQSIDLVDVVEFAYPEHFYAQAQLTTVPGPNDNRFTGHICAFDGTGRKFLEVEGVSLALLEPSPAASAPVEHPLRMCIASTFTADLMSDSLRFWADYFRLPLELEFAPYKQIDQQLLDQASAFHRNAEGVNAIVVGLEDWLDENARDILRASSERAEGQFAKSSVCALPNGLEIADLNRYETDDVYQEIFEDQCYLRHGIRLEDGDTVVDIGANIGLFSLFVLSRCRSPAIYAYEPSPAVFEKLQANCQVHGHDRIEAYNLGVADRKKTAEFTFYENSSVFSGFFADDDVDKQAMQAVVRNVLHQELDANKESLEGYIAELTTAKLKRHTCLSSLVSVSDIIQAHALKRIHLLKIDAEKSELEILKGIQEEHWPLIDQIVIEIHDPTGQTVRQIRQDLEAHGYRCAVEEEQLLKTSGLFNLYATRREATPSPNVPEDGDGLGRQLDQFCANLEAFSRSSPARVIVLVAPRTPEAGRDAWLNARLDQAEAELLARASRLTNVQCIPSKAVLPRQAARDVYDAYSHEIGHVTYNAQGYAALGTSLFRGLLRSALPPFKVIVLDCDNTLWGGVCAEDGPYGVKLSAAYRQLQEFMLRQMQSGMLLCLCSKNQEQDVWAVFAERTEMPLKREHFASWRLNWAAKSENLRSLAQELQLGLDSFIFIDDNAIECAEVRARCPEVLVLNLPAQPELIPGFLERIWAFDNAASSREDGQRTEWYRQSAARETYRAQEPSLRAFLEGLQLEVEVKEAGEDQLGRIAQLTVRTNQFNFTGVRRSESEVRHWLQQPGAYCLATTARDRFGDYGLVGTVLYRTEAAVCHVDTFLLSCRALGKGIEHRMLAALARKVQADGIKSIAITFAPTERNQPALDFIRRLGQPEKQAAPAGLNFRLAVAGIVDFKYDPKDGPPPAEARGQAAPFSEPANSGRRLPKSRLKLSERMQRLGNEFYDLQHICAAVEAHHLRGDRVPSVEAVTAPANDLEASLALIWCKTLGVPQIGRTENFFDAGGTSLKAVLVLAAIKRELGKSLSVVSLFEAPTICQLAAKLTAPVESIASAGSSSAALRGRQRRERLIARRKT
jgi:FkbH-like protein/FkbM family methyltransferase